MRKAGIRSSAALLSMLASWAVLFGVIVQAGQMPDLSYSARWIGALCVAPVLAAMTSLRWWSARRARQRRRLTSPRESSLRTPLPASVSELWPTRTANAVNTPILGRPLGASPDQRLGYSSLIYASSVGLMLCGIFVEPLLPCVLVVLLAWAVYSLRYRLAIPRVSVDSKGLAVRTLLVTERIAFDDIARIELTSDCLEIERDFAHPIRVPLRGNAIECAYLLQHAAEQGVPRRSVHTSVPPLGLQILLGELLQSEGPTDSTVEETDFLTAWASRLSRLRMLVHPSGGLSLMGLSTEHLLAQTQHFPVVQQTLLLCALNPWLSDGQRAKVSIRSFPADMTPLENAVQAVERAVIGNDTETLVRAREQLLVAPRRVRSRAWAELIPSFALSVAQWAQTLRTISRKELYEAGLPHSREALLELALDNETVPTERLMAVWCLIRWFDSEELRVTLKRINQQFLTTRIAAFVEAIDQERFRMVRSLMLHHRRQESNTDASAEVHPEEEEEESLERLQAEAEPAG